MIINDDCYDDNEDHQSYDLGDDDGCSGVLGVAVHTLLEGSGEYSYVPSSFETDHSYSFLKVIIIIIIMEIMIMMIVMTVKMIMKIVSMITFLNILSFRTGSLLVFLPIASSLKGENKSNFQTMYYHVLPPTYPLDNST